MRTETETIIGALRVLAQDIQSGDGVANLAVAEAADRMEELCSELLFQRRVAEKNAEAAIICGKIYIARNITLDWQEIPTALKKIDKLYRDENYN
jgi:hypothetical protein